MKSHGNHNTIFYLEQRGLKHEKVQIARYIYRWQKG